MFFSLSHLSLIIALLKLVTANISAVSRNLSTRPNPANQPIATPPHPLRSAKPVHNDIRKYLGRQANNIKQYAQKRQIII